jgi:hypothetical protein
VTILTYAQRQAHWDWCRKFIDREVIYRTDDTHPPIPSKKPGGTYIWQFYTRRAMYNPHFARAIGLLFWDHFLPVWMQQPFQVCACQPSGPPIGMAIISTGRRLGVAANLFLARRTSKGIGVDNWFDGRIERLPVLMVDDTAASAPFLKLAAARVQSKLGLPLYRNYFTVLNKVGRRVSKEAQHTDNYLDGELVALFTLNNFCTTTATYKDRYGCPPPAWTGPVH